MDASSGNGTLYLGEKSETFIEGNEHTIRRRKMSDTRLFVGTETTRRGVICLADHAGAGACYERLCYLRAGQGRNLHVGLSAVVKETSGRQSYWALAHPSGKPDFHHSDCFALEVPQA
jgi:hypothetical protein